MATLKVLAKKIAPGQEHLDSEFESSAVRNWYSDGTNAKPDMVFVRCRQSILTQLRKVFRDPDMLQGEDYVWWFDHRGDADYFVARLMDTHGVAFWQIGKSEQFACAARFPLYGFRHDLTDPSLRRVSETEIFTERMRDIARERLQTFGDRSLSIVFYTRGFDQNRLRLPNGLTPILIIDVKKSTPREGVFVNKPAIRRDTFHYMKNDFEYCLFATNREAAALFARACESYNGWVWHFGSKS
jgi:hypothetical protein